MSDAEASQRNEQSADRRLVPSLFASMRHGKLPELGVDIAEIGLDSVLENGLLREIPIVSAVVALAKTGLVIRDRAFVKKMLAFLQELDSVPEPERTQLRDKIEADKEYAQKVGETIIILVDKYDESQKCRLLARLFAAYVAGNIAHEEFMRYSNGIATAFMKDISSLLDFYKGAAQETEVFWEALYPAGFSSIRLNVHELPEHGGAASFGYGRMVLFGPSFAAERFAHAVLGRDYTKVDGAH